MKERIVGATVLVVVAVLVVPVFLDGPPSEAPMVQERIDLPGQQPTDGVQTVVLDRNRSEPLPAAATGVDERPGEPAAVNEPDTARDEPPAAVASAPAEATADTAPAADQAPSPVPQPAETSASPPEQSSAAADARPPARSTTGMWAVQLGSFSNKANAERLAAELRQQGFGAFLSRLGTADGELHRVRVGPQKDRDSAEAMAARLERAGQKGQVVPHP